MSEKLYLIDGHSMIYRAYYAPFRPLTSPAGEPTRATYVFCQQLLTFIAKRKPAYLAMAVDGPIAKLHRKKIYADYKVGRKPMPADLPPQVERIKEIVGLMGIPVLAAEGYEADDILVTAARKFASADIDVILISRDKDLDQAVGPHVVLYDPMKDETLDAAAIEAAKGYPPSKAVEVQTLCGDDTDNIPGIPGVGPKTAVKLIMKYGSADAVLAHADEQTPKLKESLLANAAAIPLARQLVTLDSNVPMELDLERMRLQTPSAGLRPLMAELGFTRLLEQLDRMGVTRGGGHETAPKPALERGFLSVSPAFAPVGGTHADLQALFDSSTEPNRKAGNDYFLDYRKLQPNEVQFIKEETGIDVAGYVHSVDESSIRHILGGHGEGAEDREGSLPVTPQDILRIPEITASPDAITSRKTRQGLDGVRYEKRVDGVIFYVEEVRTGRQKLTAKTMWKTKAGDAARSGVARTSETFLPPGQAPRATGQATSSAINIIGAPSTEFKSLPEKSNRADHPLFSPEQMGDGPAGIATGSDSDSSSQSAIENSQLPPDGMTTARDFEYLCIDSPQKLDEMIAGLAGVHRLAVDTETTAVDPMRAQLVGISLSWQSGKAVYLPVKAPMGTICLDLELVRAKLGPIFADLAVEKLGHNIKYDMIVLANAGMPICGPLLDTMVACHVLDSTRPTYGLKPLAAEFLNHKCILIADLIGRGRKQITMDAVPLEIVTPYACQDADVTFRLADVFVAELQAQGLLDLLRNLEMPLTPVLAEMEMRGIIIDPDALHRLEIDLDHQADAIRQKIANYCGLAVNPDSPKQLAEVLFHKLNLPIVKRTATGESTDSAVLEELAALHELPGLILEYRKLTKLLGTYLVALGECINPRTGRVHTSFHQAATVTGRLSSSDPNLQNIPIRTDMGRQIRSAFRAQGDWSLISADYSQVELRVLAHFCQDPTLIAAFESNQDIHRIVAAEVFSVPLDQVTPQQRSRAKTVNFGIIYGQTAFGLARTLRIGRTEAGEFITAYRKRFPRIDEFLNACIRQAKDHGYVETIFGRRRRIVALDSANPSERAAAERLAINSVVQGSAADLIKKAMINIAARIVTENRPCRMLLQIHDELLFETPPQAVDSDKEMIVHEMSTAIQLRVPLKVDVGVGPNWMDAK